MKNKSQKTLPPVEPVDCLASIFTARRDLLLPIRKAVLKELPLTVDEGDTLTLLYGLRKLGWTDVPVDPDGFVAVADLRRALVHDPGKFSRRIKDYRERGLIEVRESADRRSYAEAARITDAGIEIAKLVWERYRRLASDLLAGVAQPDLEAHCRVNEAISASINAKRRNPWEGLTA
jgi:DNA-binding MarR family transcriptional regulator